VKEVLVLTWAACALWAGFWCCSSRSTYPSETETMRQPDGGVIHIYVCRPYEASMTEVGGCDMDNSEVVLVQKK
jgi:hypothetical protein